MHEFLADMMADGTLFTFGAAALCLLLVWAWAKAHRV